MKLRFTYRDFILLVGIMVALILAVATFFYRGSILSAQHTVTKKLQTSAKPAVYIIKPFQTLFNKN